MLQDTLPTDWFECLSLRKTQILGDQFLPEGKTAILRVPSSPVPMEYNYLINPLHSDASQIRLITQQRLNMDKRFWERSVGP